jgi:hypothetical protein
VIDHADFDKASRPFAKAWDQRLDPRATARHVDTRIADRALSPAVRR